MDQPCLLNQNLMSFILLMKYCQGLSEKHQRDKVAIRPLLLDIIEKIRHTNTNDHLPLTIKVCSFFHVASMFSTGVDNEKVGVDNEKALELDNRIFFSYFSLISI